jgi:hypothetical protein
MGTQSILVLVCRKCTHVAVWSRAEALNRCTGDASPFDVRRRAICSQCGAREQANVWVK